MDSDLLYGVPAGGVPAAALIVDYDAQRLARAAGGSARGAELSDLVAEGAGPYRRIRFTVFPYTAKAQLQRDLTAAVRLLAPEGVLDLRLEERRVLRSVEREMRNRFGDVARDGRDKIIGREPLAPRDDIGAEGEAEIKYRDPGSGREFVFRTRRGLFSPETVDAGTVLLLDTLEDTGSLAGEAVLDIGCGYGAISCVLAARRARVTLLDSDWRAVKLARHNLQANALTGEVVFGDASAALPAGSFDLVVANPPTHAGSEVLRRIADLALEVAPRLLLVVRAHLNYERWFEGRCRVERLALQDGYKVIALTRGA